MPSRQDIDPVDLKDLLGNLILLGVVEADQQFVFRVWPSILVKHLQKEYQGKSLARLEPSTLRDDLEAVFRQVVAEGDPVLLHYRFLEGRRRAEFEIVALPLGHDGIRVDMILTGVLPREPAF